LTRSEETHARQAGLAPEKPIQPGLNHRAQRHEHARARVSAFTHEHAPSLLDYFARRVEPVEDAADLVGETLLVVWRKAASMPSDEREARMWLFGIARKVLSTYWRGRRRRAALSSRLRAEIAVYTDVAGVDGRATTPVGDLQEHVRACVRALAPIDREIIMLVHWEGFTFEEVARMLGMKSATVRSRHVRARAHLKKQVLETEGFE
jgi:RNA polymerase sigma-70 factor (ECF subfamily)